MSERFFKVTKKADAKDKLKPITKEELRNYHKNDKDVDISDADINNIINNDNISDDEIVAFYATDEGENWKWTVNKEYALENYNIDKLIIDEMKKKIDEMSSDEINEMIQKLSNNTNSKLLKKTEEKRNQERIEKYSLDDIYKIVKEEMLNFPENENEMKQRTLNKLLNNVKKQTQLEKHVRNRIFLRLVELHFSEYGGKKAYEKFLNKIKETELIKKIANEEIEKYLGKWHEENKLKTVYKKPQPVNVMPLTPKQIKEMNYKYNDINMSIPEELLKKIQNNEIPENKIIGVLAQNIKDTNDIWFIPEEIFKKSYDLDSNKELKNMITGNGGGKRVPKIK